MSNHINSLLERRFIASIGEPWDFVSSVGRNKLEGQITAIALTDHGQLRLLCSVSSFVVSETTISQIIGVNRYVGSQNLSKVLESGESAIVNFVFLTSGDVIPQENFEACLLDRAQTKFLVGSMKLI